MASEYDPDDELAQWAGGYFNAEGNISIRAKPQNNRFTLKTNMNISADKRMSKPEASGLFCGEGSTCYDASGNDMTLKPQFSIGMNTEFDIVRFYKWVKSIGIEPHTSNYGDEYTVRVYAIDDFELVLKELYPYLTLNKKIQAHIAIEELIPRLRNKVHHEKRGFLECMTWVQLDRRYKGDSKVKYTLEHFQEKWPDVQPRDSHMAPSKEKFEEQLFGDKERETFEEKTGPSPRQPDKDWDGENDPFEI